MGEFVTQEQVYERLRNVIDPELHINIVDLGLVYKVVIQSEIKPKICITMTLTTPGCPMASTFEMMVKDALYGLENVDVDKEVQIVLTFDPPWVSDMMSEEAKAELGL